MIYHCKGCGKPCVWVKMESGASMLVDLQSQVIEVELDEHANFKGRLAPNKPNDGLAYGLNHFQNCPKAKDFSSPGAEKIRKQMDGVDKKTEATGDAGE